MLEANRHPNIEILSFSEVVNVDGYIGNFNTKIIYGKEGIKTSVDHGIIIVATGAKEYQPQNNEFLFRVFFL